MPREVPLERVPRRDLLRRAYHVRYDRRIITAYSRRGELRLYFVYYLYDITLTSCSYLETPYRSVSRRYGPSEWEYNGRRITVLSGSLSGTLRRRTPEESDSAAREPRSGPGDRPSHPHPAAVSRTGRTRRRRGWKNRVGTGAEEGAARIGYDGSRPCASRRTRHPSSRLERPFRISICYLSSTGRFPPSSPWVERTTWVRLPHRTISVRRVPPNGPRMRDSNRGVNSAHRLRASGPARPGVGR